MSKTGLLRLVLGAVALFALGRTGPVLAGAAEAAPSPATGLSFSPMNVSAPGDCPEAAITITPLAAGQAGLELRSLCRANQEVEIRYGGLELFRRLDRDGKLDFLLDCIAGPDEQAQFKFLDGGVLRRTVIGHDLDQVTKVAVVWRGSVNLDLHAFEYAAEFGKPGHVWAGAPSSLAEAHAASARDGRVHGFLSLQSDGRTKGDQLEVYTLWRGRTRSLVSGGALASGGVIALALDYESREAQPQDSETCGSGVFSEIAYDIIVREPSGATKRVSGAFMPLECGVKLAKTGRYNTKTIPYLK